MLPISLRKKNKALTAGFTFIEIMIVTMMVAVVSIAIFTTLNNGIKLWQRMTQSVPQEDINILLDKFGSDLRQCFLFKTIPFVGEKDRFECATLVASSTLKKKTVGKVIYAYLSGERALMRQALDYSSFYSGSQTISAEMLKKITALEFSYYWLDPERKEYRWLKEWSKEGLPLAVRLEATITVGETEYGFIKTVSIPVSVES
jgi:hypothetical protein